MSTFSFNKLKSFIPGLSSSSTATSDRRHSVSLEPEVGFQLILEPNESSTGESSFSFSDKQTNVPELHVRLIAARHLPSIFGLKTVQGYLIKTKLFPGSKRCESSIQTSSWPKFEETFKFPMGTPIKSSIKRYSKDLDSYQTLPEKLFKGHFVVFTVFALLELPPGYGFNRFKGTYRSLRSKGTQLLKGSIESNEPPKDADDKDKEEVTPFQLTRSELKRNIGSVTCFLDPKIFQENSRTNQFYTDELWQPIKDITVTPTKTVNVNTSPKGQVELILELCDTNIPDKTEIPPENHENSAETEKRPVTKRQWSITEVKKKIKAGKHNKPQKGLCLKLTTSKMRCSIKVKEELESNAGVIYIKTTVFEHNILSHFWKSDMFLPSLSIRWNPDDSTIILPLVDEQSLANISIRTRIATKTKVGKKIVLGTVFIGPGTNGPQLEHWEEAVTTKNKPVSMWHNFQ